MIEFDDGSTMPRTSFLTPLGADQMSALGNQFGVIGAIVGAIGSVGAARAANSTRKFQYQMGQINAQAQKQTLTYQSSVAALNAEHARFVGDTNARIAELAAQSALYQGERQSGALTLQAGQLKSRQRASMAANGVDLGVGNAAEVQASTDIMKEVDRATIEANAVRQAWGYRLQATEMQNESAQRAVNYQAQAAAGQVAARNTYGPQRGVDSSPWAAAGSSLLTSAGTLAKQWYQTGKTR